MGYRASEPESGASARTLAGLFLGGVIVLSALIYWNDYRVEMRKAEDLTRALTQAADEQINGSLRTIDLLLQHVGRYLGPTDLTAHHPIYQNLNLQARAFPEVRSLFVVTADGMRIGGSTDEASEDVSDRNYFIYQKFLHAMNRVVIDGPEVGSRPGEPEIVLSRAMTDDRGEFKGVVAAALEPNFFNDPLKSVGLEGTAILMNSHGIVLSRFPNAEQWIGKSLAEGRLVSQVRAERRSGVYRTNGEGDGIDQISAFRALANYPLVVATGIPVARVRDKWWDGTIYKIAVEVAFGLIMMYLAYQLDKRERERQRVARDNARRRMAEDALVRIKLAYQDLIEGAIEGILIHRDFHPLLANESCARMFGFGSVEEVLALPSVLALVAAHDRDRVADFVDRRGRGEENVPAVYEFQGVRRDGSTIWCLNSARRVQWEGAPAIKTAFIDITANKLIEEGLKEAKDAAESASSSKTRFLAAASHDLRQPVQALNLYINVLAQRRHAPDDHDIIERIQDSAGALGDLLNSLLDMSKLEAGLVTPECRAFRLGVMLERLWGAFVPVAEKSGVSVSVVVSELQVESDPTLLERILQNFISNAVKYAPRGKVVVGCRRRGRDVAIQVWDNGVGISDDHLLAIFEEFFQVGNVERDRRQGLGLGLAIVRRLADLLGHRVGVDSVEGKGSMFEVIVPLAADVPVEVAPPVVVDLSGHAGRLVLVIDDDFDVRNSLKWQLRDWGYAVAATGSESQAMAELEALGRNPDILIVDYRLRGGETGLDVAGRLSARMGTRPPVLLLTGDTAPDRLREARNSGYRMLHKPIKSDDLRQALAAELQAAAG